MPPEAAKQKVPEQPRLTHTYQDDLAQAMNATDAPVVQELLANARAQETEAAIEVAEQGERKWYSITSLLLIVVTLGVIAYGTWYYLHLTVPIQPAMSVGVFQNTQNIIADNTSIEKVMSDLLASTNLPEGKPTLVNLTEANGQTLLSNTELYAFIGASVPEPLQSAISVARIGAVNTGNAVIPFIVASVPNPEKASQEFTNAESDLLKLFYKPLNINLSLYVPSPVPSAASLIPAAAVQTAQVTKPVVSKAGAAKVATAQVATPQVAPVIPTPPALTFNSSYFYNLPVRTLTSTDSMSHMQTMVFLYGYATNNIIVLTTKPEVLKAVYDTVVNQH